MPNEFSKENSYSSKRIIAGVGGVGKLIASLRRGSALLLRYIFHCYILHFCLEADIAVVVIYRMLKIKPIPELARPTIAILTAPMSLCLAGYFSVFDQRVVLLVCIMLAVAVVFYVYVTVNMFSLLRLKFYPTYAAFTFPYVISAVAFNSANAFLMESGYNFFQFMPKIAEWIAIAAVIYVLIRFVAFLFFVKTAS